MAMAARFRLGILGPLVVTADGQRLKITSARQRVVLALLGLYPGHVVTVETMVDSVWPEGPPATARTQISICVAALRRMFASAGAGEALILTEFPGYRLDSSGIEIDRTVFDEQTARAEQAVREGQLAEAERRYAHALGLWRGSALAGITGLVAESEAAGLNERRLAVHDDAIAVQLELGHHDHALSEAVALVREQPLRERTVSLLMLAQYRSGLRAESLELYRRTRQTFINELGIEPGPSLIRLHAAILRDDPSLAPAAPSREEAELFGAGAGPPPATAFVVPSELPPATHGFVGRGSELAGLDSLSTLAQAGRGPTVGLITGVAGVGKTSLAVHWAHQAADRYPDGRLFADLAGYDERQGLASAAEILSQFLRSLGVHSRRIPERPAERAALYRSILSDRRVLVVLDNAGSFEQVHPLLPSSSGCTALITSREQLQSLVVAPPRARIRLGVLPQTDALALLSGIVGQDRVAAAPADAARVVEFCDRLALAVRVAGARLASKPHWTIGRMADRLSDEGQRLDELSHGDARVRAGLDLSYRHLKPDAARMYTMLGMLDVPDFAAWVGAALLGIPIEQAEELIEQLVDMQLLEVSGVDFTGALRYCFQKLLLHARERGGEADPAERDRALGRVMHAYLALAAEAHRREYGGEFTVLSSALPHQEVDPELARTLLAEPLEWFEAERRSLISMVRQGAGSGRGEIAWNLAMSMVSLFEVRNYIDDWRTCCEYALTGAEAEHDVRGQACMLHDLGAVALRRRELNTAAAYFERALRLYTDIGEMRGRAMTLRSLAIVERLEGRLDQAEKRLVEALPVLQDVGDLSSEAHVLNNLAQIALDRRTPGAALPLALEAVRVSERIGRGGERNLAQSVHRLARAQLALEQWAAAAQSFRRVIEIVRAKSDLVGLAHAVFGLAETRLGEADPVGALADMSEALELTRQIDSPLLEGQIMLAMSEIERGSGARERAQDLLDRAHVLFERTGSTRWRLRAEELRAALPEWHPDAKAENARRPEPAGEGL